MSTAYAPLLANIPAGPNVRIGVRGPRQHVGHEQVTCVSPSWKHSPNGSTHTSSPTQLQLDTPPQPGGIGSHTVGATGFPIFCTHIEPSAQYVQSGTTSHSAAGTQSPVQQVGVVSGSCPSGQSGVGPSHSIPAWSQPSRSASHTPNRHTAFSTPYSEHSG